LSFFSFDLSEDADFSAFAFLSFFLSFFPASGAFFGLFQGSILSSFTGVPTYKLVKKNAGGLPSPENLNHRAQSLISLQDNLDATLQTVTL
jgi:hypothetical protein